MLRSDRGRCLAIALLVFASAAQASMRLDRNVVYFEPSDPDRQDVVVQNPDAEPMYLEVDVFEVLRPGAPGEELFKVRSPRDAGLLVSPNKLVIPPGGRKLLRFVSLAERGDAEQVYRVNVTPKLGEIKARTSAIKVLIAYQVLVIVAPEKRREELTGQRIGRELELSNLGNTNALLYRGVQCPDASQLDSDSRENCVTVRGTRLYPGNRWRPELRYDTPVEFVVKVAGLNSRRRF
jgi:P pilus assembly chaperone PapD